MVARWVARAAGAGQKTAQAQAQSTRSELEQAQAELDQAQAELDQAQADALLARWRGMLQQVARLCMAREALSRRVHVMQAVAHAAIERRSGLLAQKRMQVLRGLAMLRLGSSGAKAGWMQQEMAVQMWVRGMRAEQLKGTVKALAATLSALHEESARGRHAEGCWEQARAALTAQLDATTARYSRSRQGAQRVLSRVLIGPGPSLCLAVATWRVSVLEASLDEQDAALDKAEGDAAQSDSELARTRQMLALAASEHHEEVQRLHAEHGCALDAVQRQAALAEAEYHAAMAQAQLPSQAHPDSPDSPVVLYPCTPPRHTLSMTWTLAII